MNDETKAELMKRTREWLQSCINAATRSGVPEEADLEAFILAHIDGEPERIAAAREEQRELGINVALAYFNAPYPVAQLVDHLRATPLTATPLADELRNERENFQAWVTKELRPVRERAEKAEAERVALRAQVEAARREVTDLTGDLTPEVLTRLSDVQGYVRRGDRAALSVDYARGVADERARVVAWLRDSPKAETEARHYVDSLGAAHLALAIERGEHESEGT